MTNIYFNYNAPLIVVLMITVQKNELRNCNKTNLYYEYADICAAVKGDRTLLMLLVLGYMAYQRGIINVMYGDIKYISQTIPS